MKHIKIDIKNIDFTKPISFYSKLYGLSQNALRNRFKKLGIYDQFIFTQDHISTIRSKLLKEEYHKNPKLCPNCNSIIEYKDKSWKIYCSRRCGAIYTQKNGGHCHWSEEEKKKRSEWAKKYGYRHVKRGKITKCAQCEREIYQHQLGKKICCSRKCYFKWIHETGYMKGKSGGYRKEAGRGKMGWYRGHYCNSTWELAWVIYQLDHGLSFKRNTKGFDYVFENRQMKFYPDFVLENDNYVEIKGWITNKDKEKIKQFKYPLKVLYKKDLKPVFDYVIDKYGKSYTDLYEKDLKFAPPLRVVGSQPGSGELKEPPS